MKSLTATQEELQHNYQELTLRERELQESRNLLRAIFDGSPDMIFIHNADGHIIDVNENVARNLGFTREEIMHVPPESHQWGRDTLLLWLWKKWRLPCRGNPRTSNG